MLDRERHETILRVLRQTRFARVGELAGLLASSEATVRRDLLKLEREGLLRRVRGGASRVDVEAPPPGDPPQTPSSTAGACCWRRSARSPAGPPPSAPKRRR